MFCIWQALHIPCNQRSNQYLLSSDTSCQWMISGAKELLMVNPLKSTVLNGFGLVEGNTFAASGPQDGIKAIIENYTRTSS